MTESQSEEDWEPINAVAAVAAVATESQSDAGDDAQLGEDVKEFLDAVEDYLVGEQGCGIDEFSFWESSESDNDNNNNSNKKKKKHRRESKFKIRRRLQAAQRKLQRSFQEKPVAATRKLLTGSESTRVRDYVVLPRVIRVLDKYTFTCGVLGMLLTEFFVIAHPHLFRYFYIAIMVPLLTLRYVLYKRTKQEYFLLDYCYWVNGVALVLICLPNLLGPEWTDILWQILFVSANGPLFFAMVAWNNSLVFHSVDKVTSTYIHLFPALLSLCERWRSDQVMNEPSLSWSHHLGYPLAFYSLWQAVYLIQTEVMHKEKLDSDPELSTSLRYITSAEKMSVNKAALKLCRRMRLMGPTETFSPPTLKVKLIFVVFQLIMTFTTFLPVGLLYAYEWLHVGIVLAILTFSVYNGARYYIQVFSKIHEKRYQADGDEHHHDDYVDTSEVMKVKKDEDKKDS